ncbi:hypothetical protein [Lysobacter tyrosinilyticus]
MIATCPTCGCTATESANVHAIAAALAEDDLDRALALGLLDAGPCHQCSEECRHRIAQARDARACALAARERYRARQARLQRRTQERAAARAGSASLTDTAPAAKPALPSAAAAALARAKARAAERHKP